MRLRVSCLDVLVFAALGYLIAMLVLTWSEFTKPINVWQLGNYVTLILGRVVVILLHCSYTVYHRLMLVWVSAFTFLVLYPFLIVWTALGTYWFVDIVTSSGVSCVLPTQMPEAERSWLTIMWLAISYVLICVLTVSVGMVFALTVRDRRRQQLLVASGLISPLRPPARAFTRTDFSVLQRYVTKYKATTEEETCTICMEDCENMQKVVQLPQCQHVFHYKCLTDWLVVKAVCPCCKADLIAAFGLAE